MATVRFSLVGVCYISEEHARLSGPSHHRDTLGKERFLVSCACVRLIMTRLTIEVVTSLVKRCPWSSSPITTVQLFTCKTALYNSSLTGVGLIQCRHRFDIIHSNLLTSLLF